MTRTLLVAANTIDESYTYVWCYFTTHTNCKNRSWLLLWKQARASHSQDVIHQLHVADVEKVVAKVISDENSVDTDTLQRDEAILSSAESNIIAILPQKPHDTPTGNSLVVNR